MISSRGPTQQSQSRQHCGMCLGAAHMNSIVLGMKACSAPQQVPRRGAPTVPLTEQQAKALRWHTPGRACLRACPILGRALGEGQAHGFVHIWKVCEGRGLQSRLHAPRQVWGSTGVVPHRGTLGHQGGAIISVAAAAPVAAAPAAAAAPAPAAVALLDRMRRPAPAAVKQACLAVKQVWT